jgi:DNA repair protein RecO (recombination protein O)
LRGLGEAKNPTPRPPPPRGEGEKELETLQAQSSAEGFSPPLPLGEGAGGWGSSTASAVSAFELVWLQELGYSPRLDACAGCGLERLNPNGAALYSAQAGGVLCPQCGPTFADRRGASGAALVCLRELAEGAATPELPDAVRGEVRQLLGQTVSCVLGRRPRLLGYVDGR